MKYVPEIIHATFIDDFNFNPTFRRNVKTANGCEVGFVGQISQHTTEGKSLYLFNVIEDDIVRKLVYDEHGEVYGIYDGIPEFGEDFEDYRLVRF